MDDSIPILEESRKMLENLSFFFHIILDTAWVIEALLTGLAWIILCWQKGSWKRLVPAFAGLFFYQLIVGSMLYGFLGISGAYPLLNKLLRGAGFLLMLHYLSPYQWKTDELLHCVLFNVMLSVSALAGQSSILVGSLVRSGSPEALTRCLIHFLLPLAALYLRRYNFDEFEMVPTSCINLELTLCLGILVVNITESCLMTLDTSVVLAFLSGYFSLAVTSLITIRAVYTMCREQSDIIQLRAEKQRFQAEREITKIAQKTLDDLRCIRHDLKNQYSYMQILLEGGRYDELKEYFQKLQENLPPQLNLIDCGNHTVNTVLNMEFSKLRSEGITPEHQLVVPPVLPFPDREICSVLSNLLDNAWDECRRLMKNGWTNPRVRLEIYPHQRYLYIRCMNSTDRKTLEHSGIGLLTTKRDKQLHGYGTKIIAKLAEQYNGCAQYSLEEDMFVAQVMMDMTWEGTKRES